MNPQPTPPQPFADYLDGIGALPRGTGFGSYALGLGFSLVLTLGAYELATRHAPGTALMLWLGAFAIGQFAVQAFYFLHLGPHISRARAIIFGIGLTIVVILVGGSMWIMNNLNGRMMPSTAQMEQYMQDQDAF